MLACVLIIHDVLPEFIQTFNLSFWISDIIKCDINVPWSVNNKSFVITTKNRKKNLESVFYMEVVPEEKLVTNDEKCPTGRPGQLL